MATSNFNRSIDVLVHNRAAWDKLVEEQNCWTVPVDTETVDRARKGDFQLLLTPTRPVPMSWFPSLAGTNTLCLASGGGQQGPLLAAAGAKVTVFDNSPRQLQQDEFVARRDGLDIKTVSGDMADLSLFDDGQFDLIVHPASNCFVPYIRPVWRECFRVLQPGGALLAGFNNPVRYAVEDSQLDNGSLKICYPIPHSDVTHLADEVLQERIHEKVDALEFGHTLDDQIGGQLDAGFVLTGFYEDRYAVVEDPISDYLPSFIATRALKPSS